MKKAILVVMAISLFAVSIVSAAQMRPIPPPAPSIIRSTDCSFLTWIGALCHDTDDGKLYKWDGASLVEIEAATGTGDITDVFNCSSGDCATLTAGAADALNMTSASYSIPWAIGTDCSAVTAEGRACWDSDDNKLYVGNGAAAIPFESIAATDYVAKALFDAQTVLAATSDNTPAALSVTEQTVVGRATGANIAALAIDSDLASVSASDNTVPSAKATKAYADLMVPKTTYDANTVLYATSDDTPAALTVTEQTVVGRVTGGAIAALAIDADLASVSGTDNTVPSAKSTKAYVDGFVGSTNIVTVGTIGTGTWNATALAGTKIDIHGATEETNIASDDEILIYDATAGANRKMTRGNFVSGLAGGGGVILDLADNGVNESTAIAEIATSGDTNSIFTEPTNDKLLIDLSKKWPAANTADTATALVSNGSNCSSGYAPLGVDASGAVEGCFQVQPLDATLTALAALTIADVSVIEGTGSDAVAVVTSGGALRYFRSNAGNTALEFAAITQDDIADGSTYQRVAATDVDSNNHVNVLQDIDGTGAITVTGPSATRAITIDDAAQELAARNRANTFTENNTFGNADTDTLTLRSLLVGGNSRAVWIAGSAPTPSYATGTNELYVGGDIEAGGNIYGSSINLGTGTDGQRRISLNSNTTFDCASYPDSVYFTSDAMGFCESTSAKTPMKLQDSQTATGVKTFQAGVYVGDASNNYGIRLYDGSSNYWNVIAPTGMSTNPTFKLPTAQGGIGTYLYDSDGAGTLAWGTPSATAHGSDTYVQFNDGGTALGSDSGFTFAKTTQTLTLGKAGTDGKIVIYNELGASDYNLNLQPNNSQVAAITVTWPAVTGTLLTTAGSETWTGVQTYNAASNNSTVSVLSFTGAPAQNTDDVHRSIYMNHALGTITGTGNTVAMLDVAALTGDANANLYAMRVGNLTGTTGAAGEVERAILLGTGWDHGLYSGSPVYIGDGTNGMTVGATGAQSFAGTATFSASGATSSIPWVVGTATANNTTEATAYWESDTDILTIGDGATGVSLDFTPNTVITFPSATSTLATTTLVAVDFGLTADADAGDYDITSIDKLEGVDAQVYIDLGTDGNVEIEADTLVTIEAPNIRLRVDADAYLNVATADGGATTISATSDGDDIINVGDSSDDMVRIRNPINTSNGMWSGTSVYFAQCAASLAFGTPVYVQSTGKPAAADADAIATMPAIGVIVVASTDADTPCTVLTHGVISATAYPTFTAGGMVYVADGTAGVLTGTVGDLSDENDVVQVVGIALGADTVMISPSLTVAVLAAP